MQGGKYCFGFLQRNLRLGCLKNERLMCVGELITHSHGRVPSLYTRPVTEMLRGITLTTRPAAFNAHVECVFLCSTLKSLPRLDIEYFRMAR